MKISVIGCGALCAILGCGGTAIEVGGGKGGELPAPSHGADEPALAPWPDPTACVSQSNLPMVGSWNGFFGRFTNVAPDFRVDIHGASEAGLCGTVTFKATQPPPPPATDPDAMYPPDTSGYMFGTYGPPFLDGFAFTMLNGRAQDGRATFDLSARQPWDGWCELQSAYADPPNPTGCLPNWSAGGSTNFASNECFVTNPVTHLNVSVNCGKLYLCTMARVCECNPARCIATRNPNATLELTFDATEGTGKSVGTGPTQGPDVMLTRIP